MTTQAQAPAAATQLPNPKQAYDHLFNNIHAQAFFGRLSQRGYAPRTQKEAQDYLDLAGKLRMAEDTIKTGNDADNPIAQASANLDRVLTARGVKTASSQERDVAIRTTAVQLSRDAAIYNSVLSLKAAEAQAIAEQFGLTQPAAA